MHNLQVCSGAPVDLVNVSYQPFTDTLPGLDQTSSLLPATQVRLISMFLKYYQAMFRISAPMRSEAEGT